MELLAGHAISVDFSALSWSILRIVVLPVAAGIFVARFLHPYQQFSERWIPRIVILATCLVNAIITAGSREALLTIGLALLAVELLHNLIGYALGYTGARLFGLPRRDAVAMAMQVGIRNAGLASGLAYDVLQSNNAALASVIFGTVQNASGAAMAWWFRRPETAQPLGR